MTALDDFMARLRKMQRARRKWAKKAKTDAWRIYDRDIPGHRYIVEWYAGQVRLLYLPSASERRGVPRTDPQEALRACAEALEVSPDAVHLVIKAPKVWRQEQYEVRARTGRRFEVHEGALTFLVNLDDYLDTGLFLDHRDTRARVGREAKGKRVLNLFGYTGAFSVHAAAGGAKQVTTVDLSSTYLDWAEDNFLANDLVPERHRFHRADVLRWLFEGDERYDLVICDPPPFSASKGMDGDFEVQRDQATLFRGLRARVAPGAIVYFSANYRAFEPDPEAFALLPGLTFEEITPRSLPADFRDRKSHRCFRGAP